MNDKIKTPLDDFKIVESYCVGPLKSVPVNHSFYCTLTHKEFPISISDKVESTSLSELTEINKAEVVLRLSKSLLVSSRFGILSSEGETYYWDQGTNKWYCDR